MSFPKYSPILEEFYMSDPRGYWAGLTRGPTICP